MIYSVRLILSILSMLNVSTAFDTIDHEILLARFSATFGCSGIVLSWLRSYLTERLQSVLVNGSVSARSVLKYGVPQGSVLGPVLFIMYIYPLGDVIKPFGISYHFFADDSQLYDYAVPAKVPLWQRKSVVLLPVSTPGWLKTN